MGAGETTVPLLGGPRLGNVHSGVRTLRETVSASESIEQLRRYRFLVLASLNALDLLTTSAVLRLGGVEANPVMAPHVDDFWRPMAIKGLVLSVVWVALSRLPLREQRVDKMVQVAIVIYGAVVLHNTMLLISIG